MKRSDMIDQLRIAIWDNTDNYGDSIDCNAILTHLECLGMRPPIVENKRIVPQGAVMSCPEHLKDNMIMYDFGSVHEWEREDETN